MDAPCGKVKELLLLYSTKNSFDKQKTIFDTRSKKADLIKTLQFLGETSESWKDVKKKDCAHKLVYRIQKLMPEECGICKETYIVNKTDPNLLACSVCGHEVHHECYQSILKKNDEGMSVVDVLKTIPGFHHLCPSCEDRFIPDDKLKAKTGILPEGLLSPLLQQKQPQTEELQQQQPQQLPQQQQQEPHQQQQQQKPQQQKHQ